MDLVKTYITGFDKIAGGGLPKNSIIYITGSPGTGKSIFGMQFLTEGAKRNGESGLYLTIEERKDKIISYSSTLGWNLETMEELNQLTIIDYPHHEVEQLVSNSNPLKEIIEDSGISRVVIDSIVPLAVSYDTDYLRKRNFIKLISNISSWDATVVVIGEDISYNPDKGIPRTRYGFESLADGWIHMYYIREGNLRKRSLEVIKLKGMNHSNKLHNFSVKKGGISIKS